MATTDPLIHRLAGPSSGKAGLARDQTKINRIIAETSKGSKYYENERRKNEDLNKKIEEMLRMRDSLVEAADIPMLELHADRIIAELEATRDLSQYIVHVDMDAFYASVEILDDPSLAGKAFGVQGGVLSTASYEARKFGVRSGMAQYIALKLCPHLIIVPSHFDRYTEMSRKVMDVLRGYDPQMLAAGQDEAYLNITAYCEERGISPEDCVQEMRATIFEETKLTASAGIAPNKMLAKICSDYNKPNGQFALTFEQQAIEDFMQELPIRRIPGIGRVSERLLDSIGIKNCGDVYKHRATLLLLDKHFHARDKLAIYLGIGSNNVEPGAREDRKSVGTERTFRGIKDTRLILEKLDACAKELEGDLVRTGFAGYTVTLKLKLETFEVRSRAKTFGKLVNKYEELYAIGKELLEAELPVCIRLLGLRVSSLKDLRAPEHGIKRFFEPVSMDPRPTKRRKLNNGTVAVPDSSESEVEEIDKPLQTPANPSHRAVTESPQRSQKTLPSPVRMRASSQGPPTASQQRTDSTNDEQLVSPVKHIFASVKAEENLEPRSKTTAQPRKLSGEQKAGTGTAEKGDHICPICSKTLRTDNAGLNAHVDYCLSRAAIFEATASSRTKQKPLSKAKAAKPASNSKGKEHADCDIRTAWQRQTREM